MTKEELKILTVQAGGQLHDMSYYDESDKKLDTIARLRNINVSEELIGFIDEFYNIHITKSIDKNLFQYFRVCHDYDAYNYSLTKKLIVGVIECYKNHINILYCEGIKGFQLENGKIIAHNSEELFHYLLSDASVLPVTILPETSKFLKKAGWYNGRKIDVSPLISYYAKDGTPLTDKQIAFLEEFGKVKGLDQRGHSFEIYIDSKYTRYLKGRKPTPTDLTSYNNLNLIAYRESVDLLCVGSISNLVIPIWISSDGRLFTDQGKQLGRTVMEGWQDILLK